MKTCEVKFQGKTEPAEEQEFRVNQEGWSVYTLDDGTEIKLKHIATRVLKLLDRTKDDGNPIYVIEGQVITTTIHPGQIIDVAPSVQVGGNTE